MLSRRRPTKLPRAPETGRCERCGREAAVGSLFRLRLGFPAQPTLERTICVTCAAAVRGFLLETARAPEPAAEPGDRAISPRRAARLAWFMARSALYLAIAAAMFVLVTWLTSR